MGGLIEMEGVGEVWGLDESGSLPEGWFFFWQVWLDGDEDEELYRLDKSKPFRQDFGWIWWCLIWGLMDDLKSPYPIPSTMYLWPFTFTCEIKKMVRVLNHINVTWIGITKLVLAWI
jgi:hypothetical protein